MAVRAAAAIILVVACGAMGIACLDISLDLEDAPCSGDYREGCLGAQHELDSVASASCDGVGRRFCLAPLGFVNASIMTQLVAHYREQYGLSVTVLTPGSVPGDLAPQRNGQFDAISLIEYMGSAFPDAYLDPEAVLIGVTPLDIYDQRSDFRFVFGVKGTAGDPKGVMSTFRMNPETFGKDADLDVLLVRARKFLSRYIGLLYYGLAQSPDPTSPLYDNILSLRDVDRLGEPLPVSPAP